MATQFSVEILLEAEFFLVNVKHFKIKNLHCF